MPLRGFKDPPHPPSSSVLWPSPLSPGPSQTPPPVLWELRVSCSEEAVLALRLSLSRYPSDYLVSSLPPGLPTRPAPPRGPS